MKKEKSRLAFPHVMILLILLALISCLLTYIIPAGTYQFDENGYVVPGSFTYVENTPVSPVPGGDQVNVLHCINGYDVCAAVYCRRHGQRNDFIWRCRESG